MNEHEGRRRPGLAGWLTEKVEGIASGRRRARLDRGEQAWDEATAVGPHGADLQQQVAKTRRLESEVKRLEDELARTRKELDDAQVTLMGKEAEFRNDLQELQERNAELLEKVVALTQRDRELQAKILDAKFDGTGAKDQVKKLETELRDLRRSAKTKDEQIAELRSELDALSERAAATSDSAETAARAEDLASRLREALSKLQALSAERDELEDRLSRANLDRGEAPIEAPGEEKGMDTDRSDLSYRSHAVTGVTGEPLKAMAAGKLSDVAVRLQEARARRAAVVEDLLAAGDMGIATLPEGFVEGLIDQHRRAAGAKKRRQRRGGPSRGRKVKGRGRGGRGLRRTDGGGPHSG